MNIFERALKYFNLHSEEKTAGVIPDGNFENDTADDRSGVMMFEAPYSGSRKVPPARKASEYLKEMQGWVYSCVNVISEKVADTEWRLFKYNEDGDVEELFTHPVLDALYKINEYSTKFDHLWLTQASLELTGEAPWFVEKDDKGNISNIYLLRPDRLNIIYDKQKIVGGYEYIVKAGGKNETITLKPDEVIFLKYSNPDNPYRGLGTLQAAARTIDIDNYSEEWNRNFYFNSARPDGILSVKVKKLSEEQKKKIKASVKEYYQGFDKAHRLLVLSGDMDYKQLSLSQKDMDFLQQQNFSRNKILGTFRVPKALVAQTDDVNYANAKTAERIFSLYTIKPKLTRITEQLNEFFIPLFPDGENLFLDYKSVIPEELDDKIKKYQAGLGAGVGYMTINEVREAENLPPLENDAGDKIYIPVGLMPIGSVGKLTSKYVSDGKKRLLTNSEVKEVSSKIKAFKARTKEVRKLDGIHQKIKTIVREHLVKQKSKKIKAKAVVFDVEKKKAFWSAQIKVADNLEKDFKEAMRKIFKGQKEKVLSSFTLSDAKALLDEEVMTKSLLNPMKETTTGVLIINPLTKKLIKKEGQLALNLVADEEFSLDMPKVRAFITNRPKTFIEEVTEETNNLVKEAINAGIKEGEGIDKIRDRISELFDGFEDYRAERIARSEVIRGSNFATEQAYIQSGVVEAKEWLTAFDERTCERCAALDGKQMNLEENFFDEGDTFMGVDLDYEDVRYPPLHPSCRCTLIPVVKK